MAVSEESCSHTMEGRCESNLRTRAMECAGDENYLSCHPQSVRGVKRGVGRQWKARCRCMTDPKGSQLSQHGKREPDFVVFPHDKPESGRAERRGKGGPKWAGRRSLALNSWDFKPA